jgi:hypothetical protein
MNDSVVRDWLPPIALRALHRLSSEIRFSRYNRKDVLQQNLALQGQGRGRRAYLLATGPSLNQEDLTLLAGEDCFSLSNFFLHEHLDIVRPKYHFFAPYHEPLTLENYLSWLREADCKLPAETVIVLGHTGLPLVEEYRLFPGRKVYYLYLSEFVSAQKVALNRPVLSPQTGTIMILPVLVSMGYSEIYLLGCDHTVLRDYRGKITNFYPEELDLRINATNGNCWDDIIQSHNNNLKIFRQYEFYKRIFEKQGAQVWNLSKDSWLDRFPFKSLEDLLFNNPMSGFNRTKITRG